MEENLARQQAFHRKKGRGSQADGMFIINLIRSGASSLDIYPAGRGGEGRQ